MPDNGPDMNDPRFARDYSLDTERHQVAALLAMLEAQGFGDDDELILDAIEGETDAMEAVSKILRLIGEDDARAAALKTLESEYAGRRKRYEDRVKNARTSLQAFMSEFGLKKIERPEATLSISNSAPRVSFAPDMDPKDLPAEFQRVTIEADKAKITEAMKADANLTLPGVYWTNGGQSLTLRRK